MEAEYVKLPDDTEIHIPVVEAYKMLDREFKAQSQALDEGIHPTQIAIREGQTQDTKDGVAVLIGAAVVMVALRMREDFLSP